MAVWAIMPLWGGAFFGWGGAGGRDGSGTNNGGSGGSGVVIVRYTTA